MQDRIEQLAEKFNLLETRMRVLLTLVAIVVFYMLFELFWYAATDAQIKDTGSKIEASKNQTTELLEMQNALNTSVVEKRNDPKNQKIKQLDKQLEQVRQTLTAKTINLVPPELMANVLKDIIASTKSLTLLSLAKQQSIELSETSDSTNKQEVDNAIKLYRHSLEIVLKGSYSSTYEFLRKLENMEKKVAFDSFEYSVDEYPNAEVKLTVSTLSLEKGWIGG